MIKNIVAGKKTLVLSHSKKTLLLGLMFIMALFLINTVSAFDWADGSLVAYYPLNGTVGDVLCINNEIYNGTNNGATRGVIGLIENSFDFDTNDYVDTGSSIITANEEKSISFWARGDTTSQYLTTISTRSTAEGFIIILDETLLLYGHTGAGNYIYTSPFNLNQWYHIVVTTGTNGNGIKLYVNGTEVTGTGTVTAASSDANLFIGKQSAGYTYGKTDEIGIWNRTLNSSEVLELYNGGAGLAYGSATPSLISLDNPPNGTTISENGTNFTVSGDENVGSTWANLTYYVWKENGSVHNTTFVDLGHVTNFTNTLFIDNFTLGEYIWTAEGCYNGTINGCSLASNRTLIVGASIENQTYSNSSYETSSESFNASITLLPGVVIQAAYLYYDGTRYTGTVTPNGGDDYTIEATIDIPLTPVAENKTWYWNFVYTSPTQREQNGTTMTQEISPIYFAECNASITTLVLNMSVQEEGTFTPVDSNLEFNANYWLGGGSVLKNLAYANTNENKSNFQFCTSNNETFTIDDIISYWATDRERREYFLNEVDLSNNTMNLDLYLLNTSTTDTFTIFVEDENDDPVSGAFVYVQRWDIGTDNFHTVGMIKTTEDGSGIINLRLTDTWYRYQVQYGGQLYLTTEPAKESETSRTLSIDLTATNPYLKFGDVDYSLTYDEDTNLSVFIYSDSSGAVQVGCLEVLKMEGTGNTQVYYSCVESTAGTLSYLVPSDGTYLIRAIFRLGDDDGNLETVVDEIIRRGTPERFQVSSTFGQFISLMITGTMAAIGIASGSLVLGLGLIFISLIIENLIGWLNITSTVLYGVLSVLILVGVSLGRRR